MQADLLQQTAQQQFDAVEIIVDDIIQQFKKQYPELKVIYLADNLQISVDQFDQINNFKKRIIFLKMIFFSVVLEDIQVDTVIQVFFYSEEIRKTKNLLPLFPGALKVDEYKQLAEILQNN